MSNYNENNEELVLCGLFMEMGIPVPLWGGTETGDLIVESSSNGNCIISGVACKNPIESTQENLLKLLRNYKGCSGIAICGQFIITFNSETGMAQYRPICTPWIVQSEVEYDDVSVEYDGELPEEGGF